MSVAVSLEELGRRVEEHGPTAFLVTTDGTSAHVVSVAVSFDGATFTLGAGRSSQRNISSTSTATLLWPGADDDAYCLLVDGDAVVDDGVASLRPTRAVLHRLADASSDLPTCVSIEHQAEKP
jgi:hypothetical protein